MSIFEIFLLTILIMLAPLVVYFFAFLGAAGFMEGFYYVVNKYKQQKQNKKAHGNTEASDEEERQ